MSGRKSPKRVEINNHWYDVRDGWAGTFELCDWNITKFTAKEPYIHIDNLYFVYDMSGNKVGEFHTEHRSLKGCVTDFEI